MTGLRRVTETAGSGRSRVIQSAEAVEPKVTKVPEVIEAKIIESAGSGRTTQHPTNNAQIQQTQKGNSSGDTERWCQVLESDLDVAAQEMSLRNHFPLVRC